MEVTIIFEDLNLFAQSEAIAKRKSIRKSLRLSITKHFLIYASAIVIGLILIAAKTSILGLAIIILSSGLFYIIEFFKKAFHIDINFTEADDLDKMIQEELYD